MINWELLKQPWNWFIVGFTLIIVVAISHMLFRNSSIGDNS